MKKIVSLLIGLGLVASADTYRERILKQSSEATCKVILRATNPYIVNQLKNADIKNSFKPLRDGRTYVVTGIRFLDGRTFMCVNELIQQKLWLKGATFFVGQDESFRTLSKVDLSVLKY